MTSEEYLKLVNGSGILDSLDQELKDRVLNAQDSEMANYAAIIIEMIDYLDKARVEFEQKNDEIVSNCSMKIKKISRNKVKDDEGKSRAKDDKESEELLGQLNKI